MTTHHEEHDRVKLAIRKHIIAFAMDHMGRHFHMEELTRYVRRQGPSTAPDSAGRILRALRQDGVIDYLLVSRHDSEYEIVSVNTGGVRQLVLV